MHDHDTVEYRGYNFKLYPDSRVIAAEYAIWPT